MFRHRSAASAALLVSALALLTAAASADSVKYTEVAYGQLVPSEYPLDEVFFTDVDEEDIEGDGVVEEAAVDGGAEAADEGGEVTAQASCRSIRKPSGRGRRPSGGGSSRKYAENFMREAKRYRNKARIILIGDSIINNLADKSSCEKEIFRSFSKKGLNWGIGGIRSDFVADMVHWIFKNEEDLRPQVVYLAVGVNDCRKGRDYDDIVDNIEDAVEAIKYYSEDTQVVIQGILPTSYPEKDDSEFEGEDFKDMDLYKCITNANKELEKYARKYRSRCVDFHDAEKVVLERNGEFKEGVLKDGLHFDKSEMMDYCDDIADAVKKYRNIKVNSNGGNAFTNWTDIEPMHYVEEEGNETIYRWRYNSWSNCTGACGLQRRTAECHMVDVATGAGHTVEEALCADSFMNPLEKVCNLEPTCEAELGPLGALLRFPIPADQVDIASAKEAECGMSVLYVSLTAALAAALVLAVAALTITWTVAMKRRAAADAAAQAQLKEADLKAATYVKAESDVTL